MSQAEPVQRIALRELQGTEPEREAPSADTVVPGRYVRLHFALALESGELVDDNFDAAPAECRIGDGNLPPNFERHLLGLRAGEDIDVQLPPEEAFGLLREENFQRLPRFRFPADLCLEPGLIVDFADQAGNTQAGVVRGFDSSSVEIDFNHPLAGRSLRFRARIVAVATEPFAREGKGGGQDKT